MLHAAVREAVDAYGKSGRMLDAALAYGAHGFPVFPVGVNSKRPIPKRDPDPTDKHKTGIPGTGGLYKATCDKAQIRAWWTRKEYLIGMPMGERTGVWALDIDTSEDHADGVAEWKKITAQHTRTRRSHDKHSGRRYGWIVPAIKTREHRSATGGPHLIFNYYAEQPIYCSSGKLPNGIEVKGQGGYIVVPPSKRKGRFYTVYRSADIDPSGNPAVKGDIDPTEAPKWLLDLILGDRPRNIKPNEQKVVEDLDELAAAVEVIPNDFEGWVKWKNFGMAVWNATGGSEEGFAIFDGFSQRWTRGGYDEGYTQQCWEEITGCPPKTVGAGTIFYMANEADPSWRNRHEAELWRKLLVSIGRKQDQHA